MENYVSKEFFPKLEELFNTAAKDILSEEITNVKVLFNLLNALPLNIHLNDLELSSIDESFKKGTPYQSFEDRIIRNAIKKNQLNLCEPIALENELKNLSAFYFLNTEDADKKSKRNGIICKGINYNGDEFYDDCTVADLPIKDNWEPIKDLIPPVNAMVIIDKYLFAGSFRSKLDSLVKFVTLHKAELEIPFHLTILFSSENKKQINCTPNQVKQAFDTLLQINNLEVQLFSDNFIQRHDRLIFTNYTSCNIGIPFDGQHTRFSQNFLGRENRQSKVTENYQNYKTDITYWRNFIAKMPPAMGATKTKWESSVFTNRIFNPYH